MDFDYEFLRREVEKIELENLTLGGLLFPFLETVQIQPSRLVFAKLISSSKPPHYACFAAVYEAKDGKLKPNGNWFSLDPEELEKEGLVRLTTRRVKADIVFEKHGVLGFTLSVTPNTLDLLALFEKEDALRISNRNMLVAG